MTVWKGRLRRYAERELSPQGYWGERWEDAIHEKVTGYLDGCIHGLVLGWLIAVVGLHL